MAKTAVKWVCSNCDSDNIHAKAWVDINTREVYSLADSKDTEDYWCEGCHEPHIPIQKQVKI